MPPAKNTPIPFGLWNHPVVVQPNNFIYKSLSNWAVNIAVGCGHACRFCYHDALELVLTGDYDDLPEWAKMVTQGVLFEYYLEIADLSADRLSSSRKLPPLVETLVARLINKPQAAVVSPEIRKQLRVEAYEVWQQIRQFREPSSHKLSKPLRDKYGISKAALGAIYAHFTMGKVPLSPPQG